MTPAIEWSPVADWLCTFALHSTCALAVGWLLSAALQGRAVAAQEQVLRFAMWAALLSSTLQCFVLGGPWPTSLSFRPSPASDPIEAFPGSAGALTLDIAEVSATVLGPTPAELPWALLVVAVAITFALFGVLWLCSVHRRLRRALAARQPETDARVLTTAAEVAREQGLRQSPHVSRCEGLATPIAFGWLRPEVCLPVRAVDLGDASLRAMLAHEIAHLRRGDPAWMWLAAWLQAVFPWQILMLVVRRRWARLVELRCDAIAARHSSPTAVARCLLDVAEWLRPGAHTPMIALGMAARASSLRERIEAALQPQGSRSPHRLASMGFSVLSLSALTFVGPGVQSEAGSVDVFRRGQPADLATSDALVPASRAAVGEAAALLAAEQAAIAAEARQLRIDLTGGPSSPELELLLATLDRRLTDLERLSARLRARLDRSVPEAR